MKYLMLFALICFVTSSTSAQKVIKKGNSTIKITEMSDDVDLSKVSPNLYLLKAGEDLQKGGSSLSTGTILSVLTLSSVLAYSYAEDNPNTSVILGGIALGTVLQLSFYINAGNKINRAGKNLILHGK